MPTTASPRGTRASRSTPWSTATPRAYDVLEQLSDSKVVIVGRACRHTAPYGTDFALARFNADGTVDNTFDGDGKLTTNFGTVVGGCELNPSYDTAFSVVESVDNDTLFVVGKTSYGGAGDRFAVVSYLQSNGSRDPDFKNSSYPNGLAVGPYGIAYDAKVQDEGTAAQGYGMVTAGGEGVPGDTSSDFVLARFQTRESLGDGVGGALDNDFGKNGVATTDFNKSGGYNSGYDVARGIDFARGAGTHLLRPRRRVQRDEHRRRQPRPGGVPAAQADLRGVVLRRRADDGAQRRRVRRRFIPGGCAVRAGRTGEEDTSATSLVAG
jgi:hypothetical protein